MTFDDVRVLFRALLIITAAYVTVTNLTPTLVMLNLLLIAVLDPWERP